MRNFQFKINEDKYLKLVINFFSNLIFVYTLIIALALIFFSTTTIECEVVGDSMQPTLNVVDNKHDTVYVNKYDNDYSYGDIVVISPDNAAKPIIKRIVGLPGDVIDIVFSVNCYYLEVNGELIDEPYLYNNGISVPTISQNGMNITYSHFEEYKKNHPEKLLDGKLHLNSGEYFALGDNRNVSIDSSSQGAFNFKDILGTVEVVKYSGVGRIQFYYNYIIEGKFVRTFVNMF